MRSGWTGSWPTAARMLARGGGQIAIMSSLAGFRGLPGAPAYAASKAAARSYGEALRGSLHRHGVSVSVVCPGFVRTSMTDANSFAMPMMMEAEQAARIIRRGLAPQPRPHCVPAAALWAGLATRRAAAVLDRSVVPAHGRVMNTGPKDAMFRWYRDVVEWVF